MDMDGMGEDAADIAEYYNSRQQQEMQNHPLRYKQHAMMWEKS